MNYKVKMIFKIKKNSIYKSVKKQKNQQRNIETIIYKGKHVIHYEVFFPLVIYFKNFQKEIKITNNKFMIF